MVGATTKGEREDRVTTFQWARDKRVWMHLTAFLLFSMVIHGAGFYLFKVVYPTPIRVESEPKSIVVMDSSDPDVRSLLQRIRDRTVFLLPASTGSAARIELEDRQVRFTPAFRRTDLELKAPVPEERTPGPLEPMPAETDAAWGSQFRLPVRLGPELRKRGLAPWSIMRDYLRMAENLPEFRVRLEALPDGSVRVLEIECELDDSDRQNLAQAIESTLRLVPGETSVTGWIEVRGRG